MPPSTARPYALLVCSTLLASCGYVPVLYDPKADAYPWSVDGGAVSGDDGPPRGADPQPADGPPPADGYEPTDAAAATDVAASTDAAAPADTAAPRDTSAPADTSRPADSAAPADSGPACDSVCNAQQRNGCCPSGCNATSDLDCAPRCGNAVVERGETCEPVAECMRRQAACTSDQNTLRTGRGSAAACTFECQQSPRPCGPADGACPSGCGADPNCLPRPDSCTHIQFCINPIAPNLNQVICITNDDARCTDAERLAECAREATTVCGANHARPVIFRPPIGGRPSG